MGDDAGRIRSIVIDCASPYELASFWAAVLGYHVRDYTDEYLAELRANGIDRIEDDPSVALDPPDPGRPTVWLNLVPEAKTVKNRVHVDINLDDETEVDMLVALGAKVLREPIPDERWYVLADPEGNEFCVFPPR